MRKNKKILTLSLIIVSALVVSLILFFSIKGIYDSKNTVVISYETNGGTLIKEQRVKKNEVVTLPIPEYVGKTFKGWYYDGKFASKADEKITVKTDLKLYAKWVVYLYFDTNDGAESAPKEYEIGSVIGKLGHTYKDGYMFMGWFYDGGFTLPVLETDTINNNTTIYACFSNETSGTIKKIGSVKNISRNPNVLIKSDVLLNNSNINDYISCENTTGNKVEIICKPGAAENSYIIAPFESFNPGEIYIIKSLKGNNKILMIDDEQVDGADEVSLTIYREEKEIIERKNSTHITYNDLINIEEDIYTYLDDGLEKTVNRLVVKKALGDIDFLENTILTIGNTNKKSDDDYTCKIISASLQELQFVIGDTIQKGEYWVLDIVTPNVDDLYDELDVFLTGEIELEEYVNLTSEEIIQNIKNHEGIVRLKNSITKALPATKTIDGYVSSLASQAEQEAFLDLLAKMEMERPIVKIKINGTKLAFSVKVSFGMQIKNFKLDVTIEIENETSTDFTTFGIGVLRECTSCEVTE